MRKTTSTAAALAALSLCSAVAVATPASALGVPGKVCVATSDAGITHKVYGGGHHRGWGRGGRWYGPGAGIAILGGVVIGGALVAAAVAEHRASGRDMRRCADDFPGFDPRSGTYETRNGDIKVCPYLY